MLPSEVWIEILRVVGTSIPAAAAVVAGVNRVTAQQERQGEDIAKMASRMTALEIGQSVLMAHHGLLERVTEVSNALSPARDRREGDHQDEHTDRPAAEPDAEPAAEPARTAADSARLSCPSPGAVTLPRDSPTTRVLTARARLLNATGV